MAKNQQEKVGWNQLYEAAKQLPIDIQEVKAVARPVTAWVTGFLLLAMSVGAGIWVGPTGTYFSYALIAATFCFGIALLSFLLTGNLLIESKDDKLGLRAAGGFALLLVLLSCFFWTGTGIIDKHMATRNSSSSTKQVQTQHTGLIEQR